MFESTTIAESVTMTRPTQQHLNDLPSGTRAVVERIDANDDAMQRLMAMGLCVGREIEVVRQGNPLVVRMLGARIGVSSRLARHVVIKRS